MQNWANVQIEKSAQQVAGRAADLFVRLAREARGAGRPFRVALSGGSTPKLLYQILSSGEMRGQVDWETIEFFLGDERWVPHDNAESNYKLANDYLFTQVPVDPAKIYPIPTEGLSPEHSAMQYEATLRHVFGVEQGGMPRFDLIFLGMGDDGHTASCFPHTEAVNEHQRLVVANFVPKFGTYRITLTPPVIQAAERVVCMVTGEAKAPALREVLQGEENVEQYPSQLLRHAEGTVTWLVDEAAASQLDVAQNLGPAPGS